MEDLKILTESVCCIAREAGYFLKEERKNFSREAVQKKQAHDYVSYVDKESEKRVEDAFVVTELPYNSDRYARTGEHLVHELYGRVAGIRMTGSAALAICYVAAGRFDAWLEAFIGKWDFSAAALMVLEAGGRITDFGGSDAFLDGHHIIATNGPLHPLFLKLTGEVSPL